MINMTSDYLQSTLEPTVKGHWLLAGAHHKVRPWDDITQAEVGGAAGGVKWRVFAWLKQTLETGQDFCWLGYISLALVHSIASPPQHWQCRPRLKPQGCLGAETKSWDPLRACEVLGGRLYLPGPLFVVGWRILVR